MELPTSTGLQMDVDAFDPARETAPSLGSGNSLGDYAPLSSLVPKSGKAATVKSPRRKCRRYIGRPVSNEGGVL